MAFRAVSTIREDFVQGGGFAPSSPPQRRKATLASVLIRCYQGQGDLFLHRAPPAGLLFHFWFGLKREKHWTQVLQKLVVI